MAKRTDLREYARDYLYEATADMITDDRLDNACDHTMRELNRRGIYLEEIWTTSMVKDQIDYVLPTGTIKVEKLERNMGTASVPDWQPMIGWDNYGGALYLKLRPSSTDTIRVHIKKKFTILTDDVTNTDVPDDKLELVGMGMALRASKMLMGYFRDASNWDAIGKPDGMDMGKWQRWIAQMQDDYNKLIKTFRTVPRARSIDLS